MDSAGKKSSASHLKRSSLALLGAAGSSQELHIVAFVLSICSGGVYPCTYTFQAQAPLGKRHCLHHGKGDYTQDANRSARRRRPHHEYYFTRYL